MSGEQDKTICQLLEIKQSSIHEGYEIYCLSEGQKELKKRFSTMPYVDTCYILQEIRNIFNSINWNEDAEQYIPLKEIDCEQIINEIIENLMPIFRSINQMNGSNLRKNPLPYKIIPIAESDIRKKYMDKRSQMEKSKEDVYWNTMSSFLDSWLSYIDNHQSITKLWINKNPSEYGLSIEIAKFLGNKLYNERITSTRNKAKKLAAYGKFDAADKLWDKAERLRDPKNFKAKMEELSKI